MRAHDQYIILFSPFPLPRFLHRDDMSWPDARSMAIFSASVVDYRVRRCSADQIYRGSSLESELYRGQPTPNHAASLSLRQGRGLDVSQSRNISTITTSTASSPPITLDLTRRWMPLCGTPLANSALCQDSPLPSRWPLTLVSFKPGRTPC